MPLSLPPALSRIRTCRDVLVLLRQDDPPLLRPEEQRDVPTFAERLRRRGETAAVHDLLQCCCESLLISHLTKRPPEPDCLRQMELLMRRFEVGKLPIRAAEERHDTASTGSPLPGDAAVFSCALLLAYRTSGDLRFLNTCLKTSSGSPEAGDLAKLAVERL